MSKPDIVKKLVCLMVESDTYPNKPSTLLIRVNRLSVCGCTASQCTCFQCSLLNPLLVGKPKELGLLLDTVYSCCNGSSGAVDVARLSSILVKMYRWEGVRRECNCGDITDETGKTVMVEASGIHILLL